MITEEQRYRAYTLNIAGFALMTPFGKIFLFIWGLTWVERGYSILEEKARDKKYGNRIP